MHCDLLKLAGFKQIVSEPVLRESDLNGENGLRADWGVQGFWQQAFFDVTIVNADSDSMSHMPLENIFWTRRNLKYSTYLETAKARRASFSPFIATCDAVQDHMKLKVILRGSLLFSPKNGVHPMVGLLVGSELEFRYTYCDQSAYVFEETEQSLGELELKITQDNSAWTLIFRDFSLFCLICFLFL